ncbi:flagellar filament capping protein FliD, partial [Bacillus cereus]
KAQNAEYTINGIEGKSSTNTIEALPGVKIELLKVTEQKVEEKPVENPDGESTEVDPKTTEAKAKGIELKFTVSDSNVTDAA